MQLTTNSSENQVVAGSISPDGKFVAYADQTGLYLRQIDTGETSPIPAPDIGDINQVLWFPDSTTLVVSGIRTGEPVLPAIWSISILTRVPKPLRDDGLEACVSPDGSKIAFVASDRKHIWVMGINGEDPRVIVTAGANETLDPASIRSEKLEPRCNCAASNNPVRRQPHHGIPPSRYARMAERPCTLSFQG